MKRADRTTLVAILAAAGTIAASPPAASDEPQRPAADYERTTPNGAFRVSSKTGNALTAITGAPDAPAGSPYVPMWFIPGYHRNVVVAQNGASALVLPDGGSLLASDDPRQIVMTFHRPSQVRTSLRLGDVMDPAGLQRTASHVLWSKGVSAEGQEFVVTLPDGQTTRIDAATGGIVSSPVGASPQTDERIVGVRVPGQEAAPCLTYDVLRTNLTALGPREPLPALPAPFDRGCTTGFRDERIDRISVFENGAVPAVEVASEGVLATMDPIWGLVPIGGSAPAGTRSIEVGISTSLSVGSAEFLKKDAWDAPHLYESGGGQFRTVSVSGLDAAETRSALESISDRWAGDARDFKLARERNDLARLADGRHHLSEVPAKPGGYSMLVEKKGRRLRGLQYAWGTDEPPSCFDVELQGDGRRAKGRLGFIEGDDPPDRKGSWTSRKGLTFNYGRFDTLRPLPPVMAEERVTGAGLEERRDACLAQLDRSR